MVQIICGAKNAVSDQVWLNPADQRNSDGQIGITSKGKQTFLARLQSGVHPHETIPQPRLLVWLIVLEVSQGCENIEHIE